MSAPTSRQASINVARSTLFCIENMARTSRYMPENRLASRNLRIRRRCLNSSGGADGRSPTGPAPGITVDSRSERRRVAISQCPRFHRKLRFMIDVRAGPSCQRPDRRRGRGHGAAVAGIPSPGPRRSRYFAHQAAASNLGPRQRVDSRSSASITASADCGRRARSFSRQAAMSSSNASESRARPADTRGAGACSTWLLMSRLLSPSKIGFPRQQEIADGHRARRRRARVDVGGIHDPLRRHVARRTQDFDLLGHVARLDRSRFLTRPNLAA